MYIYTSYVCMYMYIYIYVCIYIYTTYREREIRMCICICTIIHIFIYVRIDSSCLMLHLGFVETTCLISPEQGLIPGVKRASASEASRDSCYNFFGVSKNE